MANWKGGRRGKGPEGPEEVFPIFFLKNHDGAINQIILQNNTLITTSSDGKITIWDYSKRSVVHEFRGDSKRLVLRGTFLYCCSFGVFGNQPGVVSVYDIERKAFIATYKGHSLFITDMILTDSSLFTASADHTIRAWDPCVGDGAAPGDFDAKFIPEQKSKKVLYGHSGVVNCIHINDKGVVFSGSADNTIKIWTATQGNGAASLTNTMSLVGHQGAVTALESHSASGTLYSSGADDSVRTWNVLTGQCTMTFKLKAPMGLTRHDESLYVQHTTEPVITQVNLKSNKVVKRLEGHTSKINVAKFSLHHVYTGSDDGTVRRWNLTRGICSTVFKGHKDKVHSILLDLPMMLSGSTDTAACVWEILRNEDETPDEIAEEDNDWKKRKEQESREIAAQLAQQSAAPRGSSNPSHVPLSASHSLPALTTTPPSPATGTNNATAAPASSDSGIDWMSALTMTSAEKAPPKKPHRSKTASTSNTGKSSSTRDEPSSSDKGKSSAPASPSSTKRGGIFTSLVRTASEMRIGDKDRAKEERVATFHKNPGSPSPSTSKLAPTPAAPPKEATPVSSPYLSRAAPSTSSTNVAGGVSATFAERSDTTATSDEGSESSGLRFQDTRQKSPITQSQVIGTQRGTISGTPTSRPPSTNPAMAPLTATEKRQLPFSSWGQFLEMCGLEEYSEQYEALFKSNAIELDQVPDFNNEVLKELKIKMGHIMKMMKVVNSLKSP